MGVQCVTVVIGLWFFVALSAAPAVINAMPLAESDAVSLATPISSPKAQASPLGNPMPVEETEDVRSTTIDNYAQIDLVGATPALINAMRLAESDAVSSATPISSPEAQAPPLANPLPVEETEGVSSTTTDNYAQIALAYTSKPSTMERLHFSAGVHKFFVGPHEDTVKRTLEEYHDKFERFEQKVLRTTPRYNRKAPSVY